MHEHRMGLFSSFWTNSSAKSDTNAAWFGQSMYTSSPTRFYRSRRAFFRNRLIPSFYSFPCVFQLLPSWAPRIPAVYCLYVVIMLPLVCPKHFGPVDQTLRCMGGPSARLYLLVLFLSRDAIGNCNRTSVAVNTNPNTSGILIYINAVLGLRMECNAQPAHLSVCDRLCGALH